MLDDNGTHQWRRYGKYSGMDRYEARKAIVADLEEQGYLVKVEPHQHNVGTCYRCHNDVEPLISAQWFVKMEPLAKEALRVVNDGEVKFVPDRFSKTYTNWMENVHDWCISRQLWWGHQIPAWTCQDCGHITVSETDPTECEHCHSKHIVQEEDVLDTWFSSALWPFSTLGWPEETEDLQVFLSHRRAGHRLRHHLLLGGPDDLLRLRAHRQAPLPHRVYPRPGAGRQGPQDEQIPGQRHRPSGDGQPVRRRRPAVQPGHRQLPRKRHALLHRAVRGHAQLRQQDLERLPLPDDEPDHRQVRAAGASWSWRTSGFCPS